MISDILKEGDRVILKATIHDDGQGYHPPCIRGDYGDEVIVKEILSHDVIIVHHEKITNGRSFIIYAGEFILK